MATILVVDDRAANRELLVAMLGYRKYRLLEASDGQEALRITARERPDLVISDIIMPTMDGFEFVRRLRADAEIASTKVIFYTAHYHKREAEELARSCGVIQIIAKPAEPEDIFKAVDEALGIADAPPIAPANSFESAHLAVVTDKLAEQTNKLRTVNERLTALFELGEDLALERDVSRLLQSFCSAAREIIGCKYALIGIVNGDKEYKYFLTSGMDPEKANSMTRPHLSNPTLRELLNARTTHTTQLSGDASILGLPPDFPPVHSFLGATIASLTKIYGWVCLFDKLTADQFSREDQQLSSTLAGQLGRIYENGSLYTQLERHIAQLSASEARKTAMLNASHDGIITMDSDGKIVEFNPAAERIFGHLRAKVIDKDMADLIIPARLRVAQRRGLEQYLKTGERHVLDQRVEFSALRSDGTEFPIELTVTRIHSEGPPIFIGFVRDITANKRAENDLRESEERYRQAQKMEGIGQLAGGVAHDFNNLLTVINGRSQLMMMRLKAGDPMLQELDLIYKTGERAASLTRQLLAFSRQQVLQPVSLDLNLIATDMDRMLRRLIPENIELTLMLDPLLERVNADPGQVEQVLMNLVVNARDAMPDGGRLTIETTNSELTEEYCRLRTGVKPGKYVLLSVSDTGHGMDEAVRLKIFEPFFTTKPKGKGTGLGLATVFGIVSQSGGHIEVFSQVGKWTTFNVYLPQSLEKRHEPQAEQRLAAPKGQEVILVVEDEESVRELICDLLDAIGYEVHHAKNGAEAIRLCKLRGTSFDLVITDVVMPEMGGPELVEKLAQIHPEIKVLYSSGYTDHSTIHNGALDKTVNFLQKPFTPIALARKIREVLDKA